MARTDHPLDRLRKDLGERYSPETVQHVVGQARLFLKRVGEKEQYTRVDIQGYADYLLAAGRKPSSVRTILSAVRSLFKAMEQPWPFSDTRELHLPPAGDEGGPVLHREEVAELIAAVKGEYSLGRRVVALVSLYGLRSTEISRVLSKGCDGKTLRIPTAKGGRLRFHHIPPTVAYALEFPPYERSYDILHATFNRLMREHVRDPLPGEGWHAVRRALVTGLLDAGVPMHTVQRFMGWRSRETVITYYRPAADEVEAMVYEKHPFLKLWDE